MICFKYRFIRIASNKITWSSRVCYENNIIIYYNWGCIYLVVIELFINGLEMMFGLWGEDDL